MEATLHRPLAGGPGGAIQDEDTPLGPLRVTQVMNFLIVDDNPLNLKLLRTQLEGEGHGVFAADDGLTALGVLAQEAVDAVISDILMPRMDGFALCRAIREDDRLKSLPLVFLTSTYKSLADERTAYRMGADRLLVKPMRVEALLAAIGEVLAQGAHRQPRGSEQASDVVVMQEYNATLVRKLEKKADDLEHAQAESIRANERLQQRTDELARANVALRAEMVERQAFELKLRNSLLEKEVLLEEVHHRVRNNLQIVSGLLNLQASRAVESGLREALNDSQRRIQSMALVHEHLYSAENLADVDFAAFMRTLLSTLFGDLCHPDVPVSLDLDLEPVSVELDAVLPSALVVNELVSNAIRHAFPGGRSGHIHVAVSCAPGGQTRLAVEDDGVGMPADAAQRRSHTFGLQLVEILTAQVGGTLEIARGKGTCVTLALPARAVV